MPIKVLLSKSCPLVGSLFICERDYVCELNSHIRFFWMVYDLNLYSFEKIGRIRGGRQCQASRIGRGQDSLGRSEVYGNCLFLLCWPCMFLIRFCFVRWTYVYTLAGCVISIASTVLAIRWPMGFDNTVKVREDCVWWSNLCLLTADCVCCLYVMQSILPSKLWKQSKRWVRQRSKMRKTIVCWPSLTTTPALLALVLWPSLTPNVFLVLVKQQAKRIWMHRTRLITSWRIWSQLCPLTRKKWPKNELPC